MSFRLRSVLGLAVVPLVLPACSDRSQSDETSGGSTTTGVAPSTTSDDDNGVVDDGPASTTGSTLSKYDARMNGSLSTCSQCCVQCSYSLRAKT